MNEIMEKTYGVIDALENSKLISDLVMYREKILKNKNLRELIARGNKEEDSYKLMEIKKQLYDNIDYKGYMDCYNKLMYIVMEINYRYDKLLSSGRCYKCG